MEYKHAKDYLIELAAREDTAGWLRDLIIRLVANDGILTDEDYDAAAEQLKANSPSTLPLPDSADTQPVSEIRLLHLVHHGGVNALAPEQPIDFSPNVTLLFGVNGTGKSSYFRILNEIVGGGRQVELIPNIYTTEHPPISVDLDYLEDGKKKSIHYDGSERAIEPLTQVRVFDTGYKDALLVRHGVDAALVHPMGLHLFTALTDALYAVNERLGKNINTLKGELPIIKQDDLGQNLRDILTYYSQSELSGKKQFLLRGKDGNYSRVSHDRDLFDPDGEKISHRVDHYSKMDA